jgi:GT2 family glycosyltransferase
VRGAPGNRRSYRKRHSRLAAVSVYIDNKLLAVDVLMKIGVGIITRNRVESLKKCLESLFYTTDNGSLLSDVVIVSDADKTTSAFLERYKCVRVIENLERQGYVECFNTTISSLFDSGAETAFIATDDLEFRKNGWIAFYSGY